MRIQRALPPLLLLALAEAKDVHDLPSEPQQQQQQRQIIPLAVRKMGLDEGEKFFPEQYYGFDNGDNDDSSSDNTVFSRTDSFGRSLSSLFSFGRRSPSIATTPESIKERLHDDRWPVVSRRTFDTGNAEKDGSIVDAPATNTSEAASTARLFPQAFFPAFPVHKATDNDSPQTSVMDSANPALELVRRATDALARLQRRQWGCPTGTTSCQNIGYPYSCCTNGETCYKVKDTGLGPVGCCPAGETCGGAVTDCTSDSTACSQSLGGGCCIAGYVCQGVGCVKSSSAGTGTATGTKTSTTTSTTVATTGSPTTVVVTVVVTETSSGELTTRTTTITSTPGKTSATSSSGGGVAPVKPTPTTTASGLPAGYCPTGYYACLASAGGGCCQTGRNCETTSCPPAAAMTTIVNTHGITVVVPETAAAAATTSSATCASGWFLCGANAGPVAGCCPSGYSCGTASCSRTGASATTVQKELPTSGGDSSSTSSGAKLIAGSWRLVLAALIPTLLVC